MDEKGQKRTEGNRKGDRRREKERKKGESD